MYACMHVWIYIYIYRLVCMCFGSLPQPIFQRYSFDSKIHYSKDKIKDSGNKFIKSNLFFKKYETSNKNSCKLCLLDGWYFLYKWMSTCHSQFYKISLSKFETNNILRDRTCHYNTSHSYIYVYIFHATSTTIIVVNELQIKIYEHFLIGGGNWFWDSYSGGN
jgi:hypothetical protein